jgi:hypothetical protein
MEIESGLNHTDVITMKHALRAVKLQKEKATRTQIEDHAFNILFTEYQITDPVLQSSLKNYLEDIQERTLNIKILKARIESDDEFVSNPEFNQRLNEAKKTYQEVFESHFKQTVEEAKKVDNPTGALGFIVSFLDRAVDTIVDAYNTHQQFSDFLSSREEQARQFKVDELDGEYKEIDTIRKTIDDIYRAERLNINDITRNHSSSYEQNQAIRLIQLETDNVRKLLQKTKRSISAAIRHIQSVQMSFPKLVRNELPIELMTAFLLHSNPDTGPRSVTTYQKLGPIAFPRFLKYAYFHGQREGAIAANYAADFFLELDIENIPNLTKYKHHCLSSILKRFPEEDYQAESLDYYRLVSLLNRAIELIRVPDEDLSLEERLELISCLMISEADRKAFSQLTLRGKVPTRKYKNDRHVATKQTFLTLLDNMLKAEDNDEPEKLIRYKLEIHTLFKDIIQFYFNQLTQEFLNSPLLKTELESDRANVTQKIYELVTQLINKEIQDATPSPYYRSPLCGLSLFITALRGTGNVSVSLSDNNEVELTYSGDDFEHLKEFNPPKPEPETTLLPARISQRRPHKPSNAQTKQSLRRPTPFISSNTPPARSNNSQQQPAPHQPLSRKPRLISSTSHATIPAVSTQRTRSRPAPSHIEKKYQPQLFKQAPSQQNKEREPYSRRRETPTQHTRQDRAIPSKQTVNHPHPPRNERPRQEASSLSLREIARLEAPTQYSRSKDTFSSKRTFNQPHPPRDNHQGQNGFFNPPQSKHHQKKPEPVLFYTAKEPVNGWL